MDRLILRLLITAVAVYAAAYLVPGIHVQGGWAAFLVVALIFGLVNALVRPVIELLTCPLIILTLGLGTLLINALLFWLTAWLTGVFSSQLGFSYGMVIDGFWPAFFGALVVSIVSAVLSIFIPGKTSRRPRRKD